MRGNLITIAMQGGLGKPRPALVIQSDRFDAHPSVTILPVTSTLMDAPLLRVTVQPEAGNGLQKPSQVMVDKIMTVKRDKIGATIGQLDADTVVEVERRLALFLGIAR
ncbi:type II toxin-antitoxin system PemK/MazF family toxin [Pollutimonas bauzanensis]|uniref:mRNA interferase MazF n=1 Tax=Pollutimonas bauzanensis TaxID=658167 RepID=A0A1M5ZE77_9BURK|nr:type II toxin-antitoxin system PemK/MazF family toxin [Pollutimonas bauzanensis]SHI22313.1 mRNA interferase MazF [Pollutimonas bauzanensis]